MSLGPTLLSQTAETYRKIRNSARFALGNIDGVEGRQVVEKVPREQLGLVSLTNVLVKAANSLETFSLSAMLCMNFII